MIDGGKFDGDIGYAKLVVFIKVLHYLKATVDVPDFHSPAEVGLLLKIFRDEDGMRKVKRACKK
jgi:hypothetical protein